MFSEINQDDTSRKRLIVINWISRTLLYATHIPPPLRTKFGLLQLVLKTIAGRDRRPRATPPISGRNFCPGNYVEITVDM
mgnify:FL=1